MRYLVIGAGATGGCIAGYLHKAGKKVTLIARGTNLKEIQKNGLRIKTINGMIHEKNMDVIDEERYQGKADVIFVCVKDYSLMQVLTLIQQASHQNTVVIPILNVYGTGERLSRVLPSCDVLDGCIYIAARKVADGVYQQKGEIFRIVFGRRDGDIQDDRLIQIQQDLKESGILPILSKHIKRDAFQKYSFVSAMAASGAYLDANAGAFKYDQISRRLFISCVKEIDSLANAMGISFQVDIVKENLKIMDNLLDDFVSSMQNDLVEGRETEMDGLVFEVVRLGEKYQVPVPQYMKIAKYFGMEI